MNPRDIGRKVSLRRRELGLSQYRLGKFFSLSKSTIYRLENGKLNEISPKIFSLISFLRLDEAFRKYEANRNGLEIASRTASVSYKTRLDVRILSKSLAAGNLPTEIIPHVATLLDEAPMEIIALAVQQAAAIHDVPSRKIWKKIIRWAHKINSPRTVWS